MNQELLYKNVLTMVRTPRFAVLVDRNELYWKAYMTGLVQSFSQVWGGEHFIIIPTDGKTIDDDFWRILEAYNPDYIGRYLPNIFDLKETDPQRYEEIKKSQQQSWQMPDDEFEEHWSKQAHDIRLKGLDIDKSLSEELKIRLSPFHFQDHIVSENVFRNSAMGYPFTHIDSIVEHAHDRPTELIVPMDINDKYYYLLALSRTGALSDEYREALSSKGFSFNDLPKQSSAFRIADYLSSLEEDKFEPALFKIFEDDENEGEYPSEDFVKKTPFQLSLLHLGKFYRRNTHRDWEEDKTVIIGDSMDDYCLYYSLSRLHEGVHWLPDIHLRNAHRKHTANRSRSDEEVVKYTEDENIASVLVTEYYKAIGYDNTKKKINIISKSLSGRQLQHRRRWMSEISIFGDIKKHISIRSIHNFPINCVMEVIELNNHANQQDVAFQNGHSVGRLNTPKPKHFSYINPSDHRWITGVNIEGFHPPMLPFLAHQIIEYKTTEHETRSTRDGLAYFSPNVMHFGEDIDVNLVRPKLHLLSDNDMIGQYFNDSGYTTELSDKGSYLKDTIDRFGSLEAVARSFKPERSRKLFDQFLISKKQQDQEVIYLDAENRSYISFKAFERTLGDKDEAIATIDALIERDIISRGLIFQCSRCRLAAWYSLDNVGKDFTCTRCGLKQDYTHKHWKQPEEPRWYYRLAETVYQFYKSNSHLTALALDKLRQEAPNDFHYVSETEITNKDGKKKEIDVLAVVDGNIVIGECKNTPVVPDDIKKYIKIIASLEIKPFQFILVTTEKVAANVQAELDKLDNYRILNRTDLYD